VFQRRAVWNALRPREPSGFRRVMAPPAAAVVCIASWYCVTLTDAIRIECWPLYSRVLLFSCERQSDGVCTLVRLPSS